MTDLKALAGRLEEWTLSADLHHNGHLESFVALTDDLRLAASVLGELEKVRATLEAAQSGRWLGAMNEFYLAGIQSAISRLSSLGGKT